MKLDVLIIGGGPAGATTALLLAEAGWSVGIVEKKKFPRRKVCGEFMSATNRPLLKKLGLEEFYLAHGGPEIRRVGLYAGETILASDMPPISNDSMMQWGRALGREYLDTVLMEKALKASVHVWQPAEAINLQRQGALFTCRVKEASCTYEIVAPLVILASGSWEKRIDQASDKIHKPTDLLAFKAQFKNSSLPIDLMPLLAFPGGYGGLVHSDKERVTLSCCIRRNTLNQIRAEQIGLSAGEAVLEYIMTQCQGVREVLTPAERDGNWLAVGPIHPGVRYCYKDGVFFVGNIAGEAHPVVAEGISMAMQSAWLLSQILIQYQKLGKNFDEAGIYYTKQWRKFFVSRINAAKFFAQLAMMSPKATSLLLPLIKQFPATLTLGARLSGKIQQVIPLE